MSERTPMETLREIENKIDDAILNIVDFRVAQVFLHDAYDMLRELREGAVEGFVTGETGNCRFDDGSVCITSALPSRPALLLTTKPREEDEHT